MAGWMGEQSWFPADFSFCTVLCCCCWCWIFSLCSSRWKQGQSTVLQSGAIDCFDQNFLQNQRQQLPLSWLVGRRKNCNALNKGTGTVGSDSELLICNYVIILRPIKKKSRQLKLNLRCIQYIIMILK